MSDTPRTDAELAKRGQVDEYLCRELERENSLMRSALLRTTGSLGLIIKGAGAGGPGHKANYDHAREVLDKTYWEPSP